MPRVPTHTFSMHGGAGAILSVGLMKRIPFDWFEDCVTTTYTTGGDAMISICLWEVCPPLPQRLRGMLTCVAEAYTGSAPCVGHSA